MAKKIAKKAAPAPNGKSLVIVESPAKARTIKKFLGADFEVEASIGHIRDLPSGAKEMPAKFKKEEWAYLGVDVNNDFEPVYIVPADKKKQVTKLKDLLKQADKLYLATDEDREGEAISWHLCEVLKPKVPVKRLVFHEITQEAISDSLNHARGIDEALVEAQETRRILDRLFGYDVSQLLWKKVGRSPGGSTLSAGRVQSVAVRLIVQRERERMAFHSAAYWNLIAEFAKTAGPSFTANLVAVDGKRIPNSNDFDDKTGKAKSDKLMILGEQAARDLIARLKGETFRVTSIEEKPFIERPKPPFTTSTLQQEAIRKLGFTSRRTMDTAQRLYQNGHITYMRTDSTTLAQVAVDAARDLVSTYGDEFLPSSPRTYPAKVKNAQEAHEAIRPAGHPFEKPNVLEGSLSKDEYALWELIWKRTIASQMTDARKRRTTIVIEGGGATFKISGTRIEFEGFLRAYVEGSDDPNAELADKETLLPELSQGEEVDCRDLLPKEHVTKPPARYTEASLTRDLEAKGIGRPSTYASIIDTILRRDYVFKKGTALVPSWVAFAVTRLLEEHLTALVDYEFTAQMEDLLDAISRKEQERTDYLQKFYFGNGTPGLRKQIKQGEEQIDPREMSRFPVGKPDSGEHTEEIVLRVGKFGPFLEQGERKASIPEQTPPDEVTLEFAIDLLEQAQIADEPLGVCPETHKPIFVKTGRFGPYLQRGTPDDEEKPKNASIKSFGVEPQDMTLEMAVKILAFPKTLGEFPDNNEPIAVQDGRFGPYVKCDKETRSLPKGMLLLDVTLEKAIELLRQPKTRGRGRSAPKEPIKTFDKSPVTDEPIKLLDGRYGPYVTDGETNASLPKGMSTDDLTFEKAIDLLAERAAKGPAKRKKATKKKPTKKKPAKKKKAASKKAVKKKA
ncbi:MAG: type I DNA topoisomerase [Pirellulales bacterium]